MTVNELAAWLSHFHEDQEIVAAPIDLDGHYEIIGVCAFDNKGKVLVALGRVFDGVVPPPEPNKKEMNRGDKE